MPTSAEWAQGLTTRSPDETRRLGAALAPQLPEAITLALHGDLGAGKTTLVQGIAQGLGIETRVTSPTFALMALYRGTRQLVHVDAYRLERPDAWEGLLVEELLVAPWLLVVEWPQRVAGFLPEPVWNLFLESPSPDQRSLRLVAPSQKGPFGDP